MPKGQLIYDLPEEQDEFDDACKAGYYRSACSTFDGELRSHLKHNSHPKWDDATVEEIRQIFHNLMADYGIQIY
jgi:hypothetical protein